MRRNIVIAGAVILAIGVILFLVVGPILAVPTLNKIGQENITHPSTLATLSQGQALNFGPYKTGQVVLFSFNDSANVPLSVTVDSGEVQVRETNGIYVAVAIPTGSPGEVHLINNYTQPLIVYYSQPTTLNSLSGLLGGVLGVLLGIVLIIVGVIVIVIGLILRPKT